MESLDYFYTGEAMFNIIPIIGTLMLPITSLLSKTFASVGQVKNLVISSSDAQLLYIFFASSTLNWEELTYLFLYILLNNDSSYLSSNFNFYKVVIFFKIKKYLTYINY